MIQSAEQVDSDARAASTVDLAPFRSKQGVFAVFSNSWESLVRGIPQLPTICLSRQLFPCASNARAKLAQICFYRRHDGLRQRSKRG